MSRTLGAPTPALKARSAFLSEALRPAESTDLWRERGWTLSPLALAAAFHGVTIMVADNETEEGLALAIAMRETVETPGKTAALVTPDPSIARRVAAELARWGIEVEDSAGRTLAQTPAGVLARLILEAAIEFTPRSFLALLAHPTTRFGRSLDQVEAATRALELTVFRAVPLASLDDLEQAFVAARAAADDRHAHLAIRRVSEAKRLAAEAMARDVARALAPLRALGPSASLRDCLVQHRAAIAATIAGAQGLTADAHGFEPLTQLMDEWSEAAVGNFPTALNEYAALFDDALAATRAPPASGGHPRLMILGLLEARLLSFDRVLLAGLDETVWPPAVETDAFLNRPMRAALGLSAPERRIGQTAHDFVSALGAREAILSRAKKRGGQPTVASRFLQRMAAAAGPLAMKEPEERGELYLAFARALDRPTYFQPQQRPAPRPAVELRPKALSVTRIETLRRDPYAIYAEYILRLKALKAIEREIGPRENGDGLARHTAAVCRSLSVWHAPARGARSSAFDGANMLCAAQRRSGFRAPLAQYRKRPRVLPRLRARYTRLGRAKLGRAEGRACRATRERVLVQAHRASRPNRFSAIGRREGHRLQERSAAKAKDVKAVFRRN